MLYTSHDCIDQTGLLITDSICFIITWALNSTCTCSNTYCIKEFGYFNESFSYIPQLIACQFSNMP